MKIHYEYDSESEVLIKIPPHERTPETMLKKQPCLDGFQK